MKIFVLGRPGCGKSRAARRIVALANQQGYSARRVNDYPLLRRMFRDDKTGKQFKAIEGHEGFDVIDFSVLDIALKNLEQKAKKYLLHSTIVVLEFARSDYEAALKQFDPKFLADAYFLFIETDVETCIRRIHHRVMYSSTFDESSKQDDYFVSEKILRSYYNKQHFPSDLANQPGINTRHICGIHNKGSKQDFDREVNRFVDLLFKQKQHRKHNPMHIRSSVSSIFKKVHLSIPSLAGFNH